MERAYVFDCERLDVYQKAIQLVRKAFGLTRGLPREYQFSLAGQRRRASLSIANNLVAEGRGPVSKKEKTRFGKIALNAARGCVPMLTLFDEEQQLAIAAHNAMRGELVHVANMLGRLMIGAQ